MEKNNTCRFKKGYRCYAKKHPICRWRSEKVRAILLEAYLWLRYVYFQNEEIQLDDDIDFFTMRIEAYEGFLKVNSKPLWNEDICFSNLENYFHRKKDTIHRAMVKMFK